MVQEGKLFQTINWFVFEGFRGEVLSIGTHLEGEAIHSAPKDGGMELVEHLAHSLVRNLHRLFNDAQRFCFR